MPLDPEAKAWLDQMATSSLPEWHTVSPDEARRLMKLSYGVGAPKEPVARIDDGAIPGPAGQIPVRVYHPGTDGLLPVYVYFHGGGWVLGDLDSHDAPCRALANQVPCLVVSVDYRLAPEHPYPAAPEDAYAAVCWIAEHAGELGGDGSRLALGGDSAGGNLSAVVTQMIRERGGPRIALQVLVYPVTDFDFDSSSYREVGDGYFLTAEKMAWYTDHYLPNVAQRREPYAAPLRASDFADLPPALVITAEYDPLRHEGEAYAEKLRAAGVPVTCTCYPGMIHGFFNRLAEMDLGRKAVRQAAEALREAFSRAPAARR